MGVHGCALEAQRTKEDILAQELVLLRADVTAKLRGSMLALWLRVRGICCAADEDECSLYWYSAELAAGDCWCWCWCWWCCGGCIGLPAAADEGTLAGDDTTPRGDAYP